MTANKPKISKPELAWDEAHLVFNRKITLIQIVSVSPSKRKRRADRDAEEKRYWQFTVREILQQLS